MAFDSLSEKLQNVFKNLRSKGRLTEDDVKAALKEVKMALLEADVNFKVVKQFDAHQHRKRRDGPPEGYRDDRDCTSSGQRPDDHYDGRSSGCW